MGYRTMAECVADLERSGQLVRIDAELDAHFEIAAAQRRAFARRAPALLFTRVKNSAFPMLGNLFGTKERIKYIFRDSLPRLESIFKLKADPMQALKRPWRHIKSLPAFWHVMPKNVSSGPVMACRAPLDQLPQLKSWPLDGGGYVTLPQVYTESPVKPGYASSNLGMYRVQLDGGEYAPNKEVGLHYQIHRGIGIHHSEAISKGQPLKVNIFVGGPPAMTLASIFPLPEGMPEIFFAGALAGFRIPMIKHKGRPPILAEADFCISGHIIPQLKPEGPFGDHLGYYSLAHDFPVLAVEAVYHRPDAVWPFTTVGRPPQEDTIFGDFIHELTGPLVPKVFAGVHEVHAVDAAGVHPLLLAIGSERYVPFAGKRQPQELLTCAMAVLGSTQTSLAKYVLMAAREDDSRLSTHDIPGFFRHMLERVDFSRDLHFITRTTMDTLDYTGISLNQGSKLIWAAAGERKRELGYSLPSGLTLPSGFGNPRLASAGIMLLQGKKHAQKRDAPDPDMEKLASFLAGMPERERHPLAVVVDDVDFAARDWDNFLWVTFTRSDPATDLYGANSFTHCKHWGCEAPLVIDARLKSFHAPALKTDPEVEKKIDALGAKGGPLHGYV